MDSTASSSYGEKESVGAGLQKSAEVMAIDEESESEEEVEESSSEETLHETEEIRLQ